MRIEGEAIILSRKKSSEGSLLITLLCKEHGIRRGFSKISSRSQSATEVGSLVHYCANYKETSKFLSISKLELNKSYSLFFLDNTREFYKVLYVLGLLEHIFKENQGDSSLYDIIIKFCESLPNNITDLILLELKILALSGFGLDLRRCSATNTSQNLAYISPKTGGALSYEYGNKFEDKLFRLPKWLISNEKPSMEDLDYTAKITQFFLNRYFFINSSESLSNYRKNVFDSLVVG